MIRGVINIILMLSFIRNKVVYLDFYCSSRIRFADIESINDITKFA